MPHGKHNQACCALLDHLRWRGIIATVGHHRQRKITVLVVYCQKPSDMPKVKLGWRGYRVYVTTQDEASRAAKERNR